MDPLHLYFEKRAQLKNAADNNAFQIERNGSKL